MTLSDSGITPRSIASSLSRLMTISSPSRTCRVCVVHSGTLRPPDVPNVSCRDQVRVTVCTRRPRENEGMDRPWMVIEQSTINATIGWIVAARSWR